jgi:hypothetical protein
LTPWILWGKALGALIDRSCTIRHGNEITVIRGLLLRLNNKGMNGIDIGIEIGACLGITQSKQVPNRVFGISSHSIGQWIRPISAP